MHNAFILHSHGVELKRAVGLIRCSSTVVHPKLSAMMERHVLNVVDRTGNVQCHAMHFGVRRQTQIPACINVYAERKVYFRSVQIHDLIYRHVKGSGAISDHVTEE